MTQEGYDDLRGELNELKTVKVAQLAEKLKIARGFGDLSENSEYDEAKNEQAIVMARILQIEEQLSNVKIIDKDSLSTDKVSVGCRVRILDMAYDEELTYKIVSSMESGAGVDAVTDASPMGQALVGHKVGDECEVFAPAGSFKVRILEIAV